nr:reverse transcriptase domain-containing protein [Tanacetum cinerariifolium]
MAARTTKTPSDHRRRHPLHQSMDELHGCKVIVTLQRYHQRPGLKAIQAVPSTVHGMLKFPVEGGIVTICITILIPAECTSMITSPVIPREEKTRPANFTTALHPDFPDQEVVIRGTLSDKGRTELCSVLRKIVDIFAWQPSDMTGAPERTKAIQAEVHKLVEAGIMREVYYHEWLSNPVMVKKHDGSWRMCVDFTDLNKACEQDCYPLPEINWKVESLCGYLFKCFLDAYKGYHQIQLAEADKEKTAFHTGQGVYVDDLVVKSHTEAEMMRDVKETFRTLRKINMKLNPKKCSFGLAEGVFLGYVITPDGIKPCPDKTATVLKLPSPRTIKEVQSLNEKLASLNRFLSKSAKKSLSLFQTLKKCIKKSDFHWTAEAEQAFQQLKRRLSELPLLVAPKPQEELVIYLSTAYGAISVVLMTEWGTISSSKCRQAMSAVETQEEPWTLFTDGSSCVDGSGAGLILTTPRGAEFTYALRFQFTASNNEAEYEALVLVEVLENKSIKEKEVTTVIEEDGPTWMTQLVDYLKEGTLLGDEKEARKLRLKARQYELLEGRLSGTPSHNMTPQQHLTPITAPWPFYKWGIDIAGPFPEGPGKVKNLIVAMDYFTKWIEAKAVSTITGGRVKKFVWDNIVCRFGIPGEIISKNGKQFSDNPFKDWCDKLNITQRFASVKHPQSNRLVERANRSLGEGIKSRLEEGNKNWVEELPHVLWAPRTMIKSSHGDMPFSLTYGTKAVIPAEIRMPTYCTATVDVVSNDEELRLNLDLLEERRERAAICEAKAKSKMMKYYNAKVHGVAFKPGEFVYRSNDASYAVAGGKLGQK